MAMSVVYTTINGMIVQENRGGVKSFYAPDTMGSTVALLNSSGVVTDTYTYWPYGEIRSHVGSSTTPLTFLGMIGYYADVLGSFIYVRARYLRQALTRWQTVDPIWPWEEAYAYASLNPVTGSDPSGLQDSVNMSAGGFFRYCVNQVASGIDSVISIVKKGKKLRDQSKDALSGNIKWLGKKCSDAGPSCKKLCQMSKQGLSPNSWPCIECARELCGLNRDCVHAIMATCGAQSFYGSSGGTPQPPCKC